MKEEVTEAAIPMATISRLPLYRLYLKEKRKDNVRFISSATIAVDLDLTSVQVRKDLAWVSNVPGKPKVGFEVEGLIKDIEEYFGYFDTKTAVLVGVGHLGKALLSYNKFEKYGLKIVAAFEHNEQKIGEVVAEKHVYGLDDIPRFVSGHQVSIGIITVPKAGAQDIADRLVAAGVKAIWNFAPVMLKTPKNIAVRNEDMAASLAKLSIEMNRLQNKENNESK